MGYEDNYSDWLWKILFVTGESETAEECANSIMTLLGTLKEPPDVESNSIYDKKRTEKCRKVLFILDDSKRSIEENKAIKSWLRTLLINPRKSEKYLILLLNKKPEDEGLFQPLEELIASQIVHVKNGTGIYSWWPRVIRFLCKTRNWDNSAYILLHAGFDYDMHERKKLTEQIERVEGHKKIIEVMLGQFGPRNLHKAQWNDGSVSNRPVSATDVELARIGVIDLKTKYPNTRTVRKGYTSQEPCVSRPSADIHGGSRMQEENCRIESFLVNYILEEPLKPSWTDQKSFASVVPIFIVMKPDITVAEKCCLTDYAREFPKTHFLCVSEEPPSDYTKLVSSNVYGTKNLMDFIFHLLRELKVITSIKSKRTDSCVCTML